MYKKKLMILIIGLLILILTSLIYYLLNYFYSYKLTYLEPDYTVSVYGDYIDGSKSMKYEYLDEFSSEYIDLILQVEDKNFYNHMGIDFRGVVRAFFVNIKSLSAKQGASTIDQQVIKISQLAYNRSVLQKIKEMLLAINVNFHYQKDFILLYYLNNLEFFNGIRGFKSACDLYFKKQCKDLFLSEKLFLISVYQIGKNPIEKENFKQIKTRSKILCQSLEKQLNTVSSSTCTSINNLPPISVKDIELDLDDSLLHYKLWLKANPEEKSVIKLSAYEKIQKIIKNSSVYTDNFQMNDCCVLLLDKDGNVESMNLCREWNDKFYGKINGCTNKRQTGSAIKPFLYIYAMNKLNLQQDSTIEDSKVEYKLGQGNLYIPRNFDLDYHGEVSLAQALGSSLNVPAVKLLDQSGVEGFINFLEQLRLKVVNTDLETINKDQEKFNANELGLSSALGTYEMSPLEFARMWKIFLDQDIDYLNQFSLQIEDVYDILSNNNNRLLSFKQDNYLNRNGWAVKTGTSRHYTDGWTCGVNRELEKILCVWAGNYNGARMTGSGIETAGYLWYLIVTEIFK